MKILNDRYGITTVSSLISTDGNDYDQAKLKFENNQSQFIFSSPERFQNTEFREILKNKTIKKEIGTIVFDEVHCLSEWGHDFRIAYLMMTETINDYSYNVNYLGLTATASIRVLKDLMNELSIETHNVISGKNLKRDNLVFAIKTFDSKTEAVKDMNVVVNDFIKTTNNSSAIIFSQNVNPGLCSNPNIFSILSLQENFRINSANNFSKIGIYHGSERSSHIPFLEDELKVLISTKAFGMGIDKPNIGLTMHMGMPSSRESFYQEAGRAGRDGKDSVCYLYSINPTPLDKRNLAVFFNDFTRSTVSLSNLDINQNIYFYSVDFDLPEKEKEKANEYYEQILNGKRSFGFFKTYQINEYDKYFYILHRIGVIKNWTIRYTGGYSRGFYDLEVSDDLSDLAVFKENILKYIVTRISDNEDVKSIENEVYSTPNVKELVFVFRRWYHENFIQTRKRELSNMLSMIETFGNDINNSDEVQLMMESYFNIDSIIGQSDKGYSLEFKTETLEEVINYVFKVNDDELNKRYYESERMSESYPNNKKLNLFMSLLSLRLGTFISSSNGASLFERTINSFNDTEKVDVLNILLSLYQNLKEEEKESLILSLIMVYDLETFIHKIYDKNYDNELITNVKLDYLNKILMEVLQ